MTFLSSYKFQFINRKHDFKFHCRRVGFNWKTIDSDPCIITSIAQNLQKIVTENDSSGLSKWRFSVTTDFMSFMKVTTSNITLKEEVFSANFNQLVSCIKIRTFSKLEDSVVFVKIQCHISL